MPIAFIPALLVWEWPNEEVWLILLGTGPVAVIGHFAMTRAYKLADLSFVAGIDYARLPFAIFIGWILFEELSDIWTWLGASVIRREKYERKKAPVIEKLFVERGG